MVVVTRAAKRRMLEEDGGRTSQQGEDLISLLPDAILGAIITLLLLNLNLNLKARVVTGSEEEVRTSGFVSRTLSALCRPPLVAQLVLP
jgi:hypothetical protein